MGETKHILIDLSPALQDEIITSTIIWQELAARLIIDLTRSRFIMDRPRRGPTIILPGDLSLYT